jgi:phosphoglycolate phosphatase-like HAD superfamily hydrolase
MGSGRSCRNCTEGYVLGLTTGNLKPIADMKLRKLGLFKFFDVGSYGETSTQRSDLLEQAIKSASRKFKIKFTKNHVLYFGDTPRDITAARKAKVRIISLTTGRYTHSALKREKPDYILNGMSNRSRIFKIINQMSK